jgi:hypothetical protein
MALFHLIASPYLYFSLEKYETWGLTVSYWFSGLIFAINCSLAIGYLFVQTEKKCVKQLPSL